MNIQRIVLLLIVAAVLAGSGVYWFTPRPARAQTSEEAIPPTWEYAELYVTETPSKKQTQILFLPPNKMPRNASIFERGRLESNQTYFSALNIMGNLGWEMFQVRHAFSKTEPYRTIYYFKRRKN